VSAFDELAEIGPQPIWDGIAARVVDGERISMAVVELDPGSVVPEHSHENEQLGIVLRGSLRFRVGDESRDLGPGSTWCIGAHVPHAVEVGPEGAEVIDVFAPVRDDWHAVPRGTPRSPRWPAR